MEENKIRVTKAQRFNDIKAILMGEAVSFNTTVEDAIAVIDKELEQLAKKNLSSSKKQEQNRETNNRFKEIILDFLRSLPNDSEGVTCDEIWKAIPEFAENELSVQKVISLMSSLRDDNKAVGNLIKGKKRFTLA